MWNDLDGEMRRVAAVLGVAVDETRWPEFVEAATLDSMRARASDTAPDAHLGLWQSATEFFRVGGSRDWEAILTAEDAAHFHERLSRAGRRRDALGAQGPSRAGLGETLMSPEARGASIPRAMPDPTEYVPNRLSMFRTD